MQVHGKLLFSVLIVICSASSQAFFQIPSSPPSGGGNPPSPPSPPAPTPQGTGKCVTFAFSTCTIVTAGSTGRVGATLQGLGGVNLLGSFTSTTGLTLTTNGKCFTNAQIQGNDSVFIGQTGAYCTEFMQQLATICDGACQGQANNPGFVLCVDVSWTDCQPITSPPGSKMPVGSLPATFNQVLANAHLRPNANSNCINEVSYNAAASAFFLDFRPCTLLTGFSTGFGPGSGKWCDGNCPSRRLSVQDTSNDLIATEAIGVASSIHALGDLDPPQVYNGFSSTDTDSSLQSQLQSCEKIVHHSYLHVTEKGHAMALAVPIANNGAPENQCPCMGIHAVLEQDHQRLPTFNKQLLIWPNNAMAEFVHKVENDDAFLYIGSFTGQELIDAAQQASVARGSEYDIIANNCFDLMLSLASKLDVSVDLAITTFVTRQLWLSSGKQLVEKFRLLLGGWYRLDSDTDEHRLLAADLEDENLVQWVVESKATGYL